ncbi:MAG: hypothetical protein K9L70_09605 [Thiohalocapsa sp.]|nr:hypothetical protein [Thiohalocapsa sp.]MCF7990569.1 hypothetical protein [Thiohalocapsa sp.]
MREVNILHCPKSAYCCSFSKGHTRHWVAPPADNTQSDDNAVFLTFASCLADCKWLRFQLFAGKRQAIRRGPNALAANARRGRSNALIWTNESVLLNKSSLN